LSSRNAVLSCTDQRIFFEQSRRFLFFPDRTGRLLPLSHPTSFAEEPSVFSFSDEAIGREMASFFFFLLRGHPVSLNCGKKERDPMFSFLLFASFFLSQKTTDISFFFSINLETFLAYAWRVRLENPSSPPLKWSWQGTPPPSSDRRGCPLPLFFCEQIRPLFDSFPLSFSLTLKKRVFRGFVPRRFL